MTGEPAKEDPLPNERELIRELLALREKRVRRGPAGAFIRESHPKQHGCVRATFSLEPDLPEELRVGVFAEPRPYPAWIRFSNATGPRSNAGFRSDTRPDVRGLAIKLMGVEGDKLLEEERHETTQDFLLISADALIAHDLAGFVELLGEPRVPRLLWYFLNPFDLHLRELGIGLRSLRRHSDPLETQYSSVVPFLFGDRAVKYRARPVSDGPTPRPTRRSANLLREAMQRRLSAGRASFDFLVQVQTHPVGMPIEDPSIVWDEHLSPFRKVATIEIPAQRFDSEAQLAFCENLSFTPWHSLGPTAARRHQLSSQVRLPGPLPASPRPQPRSSPRAERRRGGPVVTLDRRRRRF